MCVQQSVNGEKHFSETCTADCDDGKQHELKLGLALTGCSSSPFFLFLLFLFLFSLCVSSRCYFFLWWLGARAILGGWVFPCHAHKTQQNQKTNKKTNTAFSGSICIARLRATFWVSFATQASTATGCVARKRVFGLHHPNLEP